MSGVFYKSPSKLPFMRTTKHTLLIIITALTSLVQLAEAQPNFADFKKRFAKLDSENLSQHYKGIVTSQGVEKGLFPIQATGVTTKPIKKAAGADRDTRARP